MDDDPIRRRAEEIRAEQATAAQGAAVRETELRDERLFFVQRFLDTLTSRTAHSLECIEAIGKPHAAIARFSFLREGKPGSLTLFEFGIARVDGETGARSFLYYLEPTSAAFGIPNPETGVAQALHDSSDEAVRNYAVAIAFETMARVVASGGILGSAAQIEVELEAQKRRERLRAAKERDKLFGGCLMAIFGFFGFVVVVGAIGSLLRSCGGSG